MPDDKLIAELAQLRAWKGDLAERVNLLQGAVKICADYQLLAERYEGAIRTLVAGKAEATPPPKT